MYYGPLPVVIDLDSFDASLMELELDYFVFDTLEQHCYTMQVHFVITA